MKKLRFVQIGDLAICSFCAVLAIRDFLVSDGYDIYWSVLAVSNLILFFYYGREIRVAQLELDATNEVNQ